MSFIREEDRNTLVEGEPDARPMGIGKGPKPPSYNVQTAVDAETGLIIHHEVTGEPNDTRQLYPMAKATKDMLLDLFPRGVSVDTRPPYHLSRASSIDLRPNVGVTANRRVTQAGQLKLVSL